MTIRHNSGSAGRRKCIAVITGPVIVERNMEHVLYRIGELLSAHYDVDLIGPIKASERLRQDFRIFPATRSFGARLLPVWGPRLMATQRYLKKNSPDLFMAVSAIGVNGLAAAIAGRLWRRPSVVRVTSDIFQVYKAEANAYRKARMFIRNNLLGRLTLRLADRVVVLHEQQSEELKQKRGLRNKVLAVSQPITFSSRTVVDTELQALRQRCGIPSDAYVVGYVGRLDYGKRPEILLETVKLLLAGDPLLHALIVGDGGCRSWLEENLSYSARVYFAGQQPRDELVAYYRLMDVLLHTSRSEGLSTVIAEAIFLGLPVVATDSGVITRSLVSNIADAASGLADTILSRKYKQDQLPASMLPENNAVLWLDLIEKTLSECFRLKIT